MVTTLETFVTQPVFLQTGTSDDVGTVKILDNEGGERRGIIILSYTNYNLSAKNFKELLKPLSRKAIVQFEVLSSEFPYSLADFLRVRVKYNPLFSQEFKGETIDGTYFQNSSNIKEPSIEEIERFQEYAKRNFQELFGYSSEEEMLNSLKDDLSSDRPFIFYSIPIKKVLGKEAIILNQNLDRFSEPKVSSYISKNKIDIETSISELISTKGSLNQVFHLGIDSLTSITLAPYAQKL